jgi:hypothetical protein
LSPRIFEPDEPGGRAWPCVAGLDYVGASAWLADARAPMRLLEPTLAIRRALTESKELGGVAGNCVVAALVLGCRLDLDGWSPTLVSCTWRGGAHHYVRVDDWALDPTAEQFGAGEPLVFEIGSTDNEYFSESAWGVTPCEGEVVSELGFWLARQLPHPDGDDWRRDTIAPLLRAVGLTRLLPAVEEAAEGYAAEIHQRIRDEMEWSEARDEA